MNFSYRYNLIGGLLQIEKAIAYDSGNFTCEVSREGDPEIIKATTQIKVKSENIFYMVIHTVVL